MALGIEGFETRSRIIALRRDIGNTISLLWQGPMHGAYLHHWRDKDLMEAKYMYGSMYIPPCTRSSGCRPYLLPCASATAWSQRCGLALTCAQLFHSYCATISTSKNYQNSAQPCRYNTSCILSSPPCLFAPYDQPPLSFDRSFSHRSYRHSQLLLIVCSNPLHSNRLDLAFWPSSLT